MSLLSEDQIINAFLSIKIEDAQASLAEAARATTFELHQKYYEQLTAMQTTFQLINELYEANQQMQTLHPIIVYAQHWQAVLKDLFFNLLLMGRVFNLDDKSLFVQMNNAFPIIPVIIEPNDSRVEMMKWEEIQGQLDVQCVEIAGMTKRITSNIEKSLAAVNNLLDEILDGGSDIIPKRHLSVDDEFEDDD